MMQKNLMKTVYLMFLGLTGTVWPWILASAQDYTSLTVTVPFPTIRAPDLVCSTGFKCVDTSGNPTSCDFSCNTATPPCDPTTQIKVIPQLMSCKRGDRGCSVPVNPGPTTNVFYDPFHNVLLSSVDFPVTTTLGDCHCDITFSTDPAPAGGQRAIASLCTGQPLVFPATNPPITTTPPCPPPPSTCPSQRLGRYQITGVQYTGGGNDP